MKYRLVVALVSSMLALNACSRDRHFDLNWEEEVLLHDGTILPVKVKYTYERLSLHSLGRYDNAIPRDTEMSFDAGPPIGLVQQKLKGFHPMLLDRKDGVWYMVMYGSHYRNSEMDPSQNWGESENGYGQRTARLESSAFKPISMRELPAVFDRPNMLMLYGTAKEHAEFDGKRVTLELKRFFLQLHPLGYSHARFTRPLPSAPTFVAPSNNPTQRAGK
jgi:hypothetical protein